MASSYDWSTFDPSKLYGKYSSMIGDRKADRDATYVGLKPEFTQGFDWKDPNSTLNLGGTTLKNPYSYAYRDPENGYAGMNGLVDDTWKEFNPAGGNGLGGYAARVDSNAGGRIGLTGYIGPDGTEGTPFLAAPQGTRFYGNILESDPKLAAKLKEYVFQGADGELLVPEEQYKNWTHELGYWHNAPGFMTLKGLLGDTAFPVIAAALGGMAAEGAGLLGAAGEAGSVGSAFPSAAGDGFYNWATTSGMGGGAGFGGAGGGVFNLSDPATWVGGEGLATTGGGLGWDAATIPADYFSNILAGGTGVGAEALASTPGLLDQFKNYIINSYTTPEGLAKQGASQILKSLLGDSSGTGNIDGSGDSIFGPLVSTQPTGSVFDNSSIFSGSGGGGGGVDFNWTDFLTKNAGSLLQGGASLISGALGANAAGNASDAQQQAAAAAIAEQKRQYDLARADNAPFRDTGVAGNLRLRQLLGLQPGYTGADSGDLLKRFTMADRDADPVYQSGLEFGLNEGRKAIDSRALATGMYDSGATLKALTRYGNDYGSTKANDSYNRFNQDQTNIFNRLAGVSGAGQTATNAVTAAGANAANQIGQSIEGAGNSRAASVIGGANAWSNALGGVSSAIGSANESDILKKILAQKYPGILF